MWEICVLNVVQQMRIKSGLLVAAYVPIVATGKPWKLCILKLQMPRRWRERNIWLCRQECVAHAAMPWGATLPSSLLLLTCSKLRPADVPVLVFIIIGEDCIHDRCVIFSIDEVFSLTIFNSYVMVVLVLLK